MGKKHAQKSAPVLPFSANGRVQEAGRRGAAKRREAEVKGAREAAARRGAGRRGGKRKSRALGVRSERSGCGMRYAGQAFFLAGIKKPPLRKQRTRFFSPAGSKSACKKKNSQRALLAANSFSILTVSVLIQGIFSALRATVYHDASDSCSQSPCFLGSEEKNLVRCFHRCHVSSQERKIFRPPAGGDDFTSLPPASAISQAARRPNPANPPAESGKPAGRIRQTPPAESGKPGGVSYSPACSRSVCALSVCSHGRSMSVRPK